MAASKRGGPTHRGMSEFWGSAGFETERGH